MRWFAELDRRNLDAVEQILAEDYFDRNPAIPDLPAGREGVRDANRQLYAAFEDVTHVIQDQLAEGDKVLTRVVVHCRFTGPVLGYSRTGRYVELEGSAVHRIVDGKFVAHWAHADLTKFMLQVGASFSPSAG